MSGPKTFQGPGTIEANDCCLGRRVVFDTRTILCVLYEVSSMIFGSAKNGKQHPWKRSAQEAAGRSGDAVDPAYVLIDGEQWFQIENSHLMPEFFTTPVSPDNHWMFVSSHGAVTAGRKDAEHALFSVLLKRQAGGHGGSFRFADVDSRPTPRAAALPFGDRFKRQLIAIHAHGTFIRTSMGIGSCLKR